MKREISKGFFLLLFFISCIQSLFLRPLFPPMYKFCLNQHLSFNICLDDLFGFLPSTTYAQHLFLWAKMEAFPANTFRQDLRLLYLHLEISHLIYSNLKEWLQIHGKGQTRVNLRVVREKKYVRPRIDLCAYAGESFLSRHTRYTLRTL